MDLKFYKPPNPGAGWVGSFVNGAHYKTYKGKHVYWVPDLHVKILKNLGHEHIHSVAERLCDLARDLRNAGVETHIRGWKPIDFLDDTTSKAMTSGEYLHIPREGACLLSEEARPAGLWFRAFRLRQFRRKILRAVVATKACRRISVEAAYLEWSKVKNIGTTPDGPVMFDLDHNDTRTFALSEADLNALRAASSWPVGRDRPYQDDIREDPETRLSRFGIHVSGLSVLDLGCNTGRLTEEALRAGASYAFGCDANDAAVTLASATSRGEFFPIDLDSWWGEDLIRTASGRGSFDVTLLLSVLRHVRRPSTLMRSISRLTTQVCLVEGHAGDTHNSYPALHQWEGSIEAAGYSTDRSKRPLWILRKR